MAFGLEEPLFEKYLVKSFKFTNVKRGSFVSEFDPSLLTEQDINPD